MGCNCGKPKPARPTAPPANPRQPQVEQAVIAAARAGGQWRLRTPTGTAYDFPTLAAARSAQREHGGTVTQRR